MKHTSNRYLDIFLIIIGIIMMITGGIQGVLIKEYDEGTFNLLLGFVTLWFGYQE